MRNLLCILAITFSFAASAKERKTIHFNSRGVVSGAPSANIEIGEKTSTRTAFYVGALIPSGQALENDFDIELRQQRAYFRFSFFQNGAFQNGYHAGGFVDYTVADIQIKDEDIEDKISGVGAGLLAGYMWSFQDLTLGSTIALKASSYDTKKEYKTSTSTASFNLPHHEGASVSFDLGYRF